MSGRFLGSLALLAALAAAGCASDWEAAYEQSEQEKLDLHARLETLQQERAAEAARAEALDQQNRAMDKEIARIRADAAEANKLANDWKAKADQSASQPVSSAPVASGRDTSGAEAAAAKLRPIYGDGVSITPDGNVEVTLASDVTFASGSTSLTDAGKKSLRRIAGLLNGEFGSYLIRIEGHTDNEPLKRTKELYGDNRGLGAARALEVVRFMENDLRVDPRRLTSASKGEHEPVADNTSAAGRAKNRRVEVVVVIPGDGAEIEAK